MEMAISSGAPEEVTGLLALLNNMNKASVTRELTGCYGGKRGSPPRADENGLFRMTVPLLHAAFTGSTAMFSTVLRAMRAKLRAQQASTIFVWLAALRGILNACIRRDGEAVERRVLVSKHACPALTQQLSCVHEASFSGLHPKGRAVSF